MANPARAYLTTQVETTTQGELLIMLYEAAIKFLKRAKIEIDNKDYAKKGIYISKAMAIIHELAECLNKEKGGDITPKLSQLYLFCTTQLVKANIRLDNKMIDEVINILDGLRSAYAQIVPIYEGKTAPAGVQAPIPPQPVLQVPTPKPAAPQQPSSQTPTQQTKSQNQVAEPTIGKENKTTAPLQPVPPVKPRTAANAARFRAANAYTNANR
ncbi:MAG: flagellar export chaperone FliS [Pseudodesulfovibrio sp.]|nr:flagellar export chaperone FliS [Pseudodesulfovibrio sp.]